MAIETQEAPDPSPGQSGDESPPPPGDNTVNPDSGASQTAPEAGVGGMVLDVHQAMLLIQAAIGVIAKTVKEETDLRYAFRGVDEVVNAIQPLLIKHGVTVVPESEEMLTRESKPTRNGGKAWCIVILVTWRWTGPDGSSCKTQSIGEAQDWSDKGSSQAFSTAQRENFVKSLNIPTEAPHEYEERDELGDNPAPKSAGQQWLESRSADELLAEVGTIQTLDELKEFYSGARKNTRLTRDEFVSVKERVQEHTEFLKGPLAPEIKAEKTEDIPF